MASQFSISVILKAFDQMSPTLNKLSGQMDTFGKKMTGVGKRMSLAVTAPLMGVGALAFAESKRFNAAMANIATLIPGQSERVLELRDDIRDLMVDTGKMGTDVAGGVYQVISAFGDSADTMKIAEINARAAVAGIAQTADAANLTSAAMKAYGDTSAEAAQKAADLAFTTVKLGQTTFPELASSIGKVMPWGAQLGIQQEQLWAGFATLTGVTGNTAEVSTQLAGILQGLVRTTPAMKEALKYLGYESGKAMVDSLGLVGALEELNHIVGGNEEALGMMFGRKEPLLAMFALLGRQAKDYAVKSEAMAKATGAQTEAFKEQTSGINRVGFEWDRAMRKLDIVRQRLGDVVGLEMLDHVFPKVDELTKKFEELDASTLKWVVQLGTVAAVIGPALIAIGWMAQGIVALAKGFVYLWVAARFAIMRGIIPILKYLAAFIVKTLVPLAIKGLVILAATFGWMLIPIVLAIAGLVIAGYYLIKHWDKVKVFFAEMWNEIKAIFFSGIGFVLKRVQTLLNFIPERIRLRFGIDEEAMNSINEMVAKYGQLQEQASLGGFGSTQAARINEALDYAFRKMPAGIGPLAQPPVGQPAIVPQSFVPQSFVVGAEQAKSSTEITMRIIADRGLTQVVDYVKREGEAKVNLVSEVERGPQ